MLTSIVEQKAAKMSYLIDRIHNFEDIIGKNYFDLKEMVEGFKSDANALSEENRLLRIAIVGQVNAGKSSFLNALLFGGNGVLPKSAKPMTAALSVIRYSSELKAEIEYFTKEDWNTLESLAEDYRKEYEAAKNRLKASDYELRENGGLFGRSATLQPMTEQRIKDQMFSSDEEKAAFEVVEMARQNRLPVDNYLGKTEVIDHVETIDDLMGRLQDYVGADGKFTPIVRNSIIYYNDPNIEDIEIVDTPGINDPVISRGRRTKEFLGKCDVVFVLSYSGQFLDQADMELLAQNLPSKGINHVVLVGTQFDSVMLQEYTKYKDITQLLDHLEVKLENHAEHTFKNLLTSCHDPREQEILHRLEEGLPPLFISSMAYNIAKHEGNLNAEEQHFNQMYQKMYTDFSFDNETLLDLSNIAAAEEKLLDFKKEKETILANRLSSLVEGVEQGFRQKLIKVMEETERTVLLLQTEDVASLKEKEEAIVKRLEKGRNKIEASFETALLKMKQKLSMLITEIKEVSRQFSQARVQTDSYTDYYTVSTSKWWNPFSWGSSEKRTRTISYRYANVHDSIDQIEEFVFESERRLKQTIIDIVDLHKLRSEMKEATISLFDLSDETFDIDSVLLPIERAVSQITIPEIEFGDQDYSSIISKQFNGQVKDSSIENLQVKQREAVQLIFKDFRQAVDSKSKEITQSLSAIQEKFVNNIIQNIKDDLDQLRSQLANKEAALSKNRDFLNVINREFQNFL